MQACDWSIQGCSSLQLICAKKRQLRSNTDCPNNFFIKLFGAIFFIKLLFVLLHGQMLKGKDIWRKKGKKGSNFISLSMSLNFSHFLKFQFSRHVRLTACHSTLSTPSKILSIFLSILSLCLFGKWTLLFPKKTVLGITWSQSSQATQFKVGLFAGPSKN